MKMVKDIILKLPHGCESVAFELKSEGEHKLDCFLVTILYCFDILEKLHQTSENHGKENSKPMCKLNIYGNGHRVSQIVSGEL